MCDAGHAEVDVQEIRLAFERWCEREPRLKMTSGFLYYDAFKAGYQHRAERNQRLAAQVAALQELGRAVDGADDKETMLRRLDELQATLANPDAGAERLLHDAEMWRQTKREAGRWLKDEGLSNPDAEAERLSRRNAALDAFFEAVTQTGGARILCDMEDYGRELGDIVTVDVGLTPNAFATGEFSAELVRLAMAEYDAAAAEGGEPVDTERVCGVPGQDDGAF